MIPCPCCRASNDVGPTCRRCRADLSLLFTLDARRDVLISEARRLAADSPRQALGYVEQAEALRPAPELRRMRAALLVLAGDFAAAVRSRPPGGSPPAG